MDLYDHKEEVETKDIQLNRGSENHVNREVTLNNVRSVISTGVRVCVSVRLFSIQFNILFLDCGACRWERCGRWKTTILYDYYVLKITFNQSTANYGRINDNNHRQVFKYMQHMRTELFFLNKKWKKFISKFIHFPIKSTVHSWNTYIFYFVTKSINPISWQIYTCRVHGWCLCMYKCVHSSKIMLKSQWNFHYRG